jgi:hypothetical protein
MTDKYGFSSEQLASLKDTDWRAAFLHLGSHLTTEDFEYVGTTFLEFIHSKADTEKHIADFFKNTPYTQVILHGLAATRQNPETRQSIGSASEKLLDAINQIPVEETDFKTALGLFAAGVIYAENEWKKPNAELEKLEGEWVKALQAEWAKE